MIPSYYVPNDPTYVAAEISANPIWALAFSLSEVDNDNAPLGWFRYIHVARWVIENYKPSDAR